MTIASATRRVLQFSFFAFAAFMPFSIAGMNIAFGFGALAWIVASILARTGANAGTPRVSLRRDPLVPASLALALSALPSVLISENFDRAVNDWTSYWELLILFWVARNVRALGIRDAVYGTLVVSATLSSLVGMVQRAGGFDLGPIHIGHEYRVGSTLYTMTFAGIMYQVVVLGSAVALTRSLGLRRRLSLAGALLLQCIAIVLTMTRGAWIALAGGLSTVVVMARKRVMTWSVVGLLTVLVAFAFVNFKQEGRSIPQLLHSGLDKDASTRLVLWDIAWQLFKEHPLLGVGMGDYSIEADKMLAGRKVTTTVDTHNVYLHVLATRGLVGFVPFVLFWFVLLRELVRLMRRKERGTLDYQYAVGAIAATVAVLLGALTELNIDDSEVFMAFMFMIGLVLSSRYDATVQSPATRRTT